MNILVTGGSGFIGTNLVTDLLKEGHNVTIYDKQKSDTYPDLCILADVRDKEKLTRSMRGVDAVYHLAAEHRDDVQPTSLYYDVNVGGAENIVYALKKNDVKRLIFISTVAVYGLNAGEPQEDSPLKPFNDYGKSKNKSETIFNKWADSDPKNCLITVRPTVIFGEKNRGNVYNLLHQLSTGNFIKVGKGINRKSMGYVFNLTSFLVSLLKFPPGEFVYNYADKPDLCMNELIDIFHNTLGKNHKNNFIIPYALGLMGGYCYDLMAKITGKTYPISSIRIRKFCADTVINTDKLQQTGFVPSYILTEGLRRMIRSEFL
ncbi:NAD-dependent epimerase/dehydratase family protein [Thermodesulfobacteriota bacterium]